MSRHSNRMDSYQPKKPYLNKIKQKKVGQDAFFNQCPIFDTPYFTKKNFKNQKLKKK